MTIQIQEEIEKEVTSLLSRLIQINTTNPPGNETKATNFLSKILTKEGLKCELYESAPQRGNMITRLKGTGEKPNLLLLSHLDVVPANPAEWSVDPFGGLVKDGFVWGRGAIDMKGMTAVEVLTLLLLNRNNVKLKGDLILAATADEESGSLAGADFMLRNYKDKVWAPYVINEGGGLALPSGTGNVFTVQTAEKGLLWFRVKARGSSGHGSLPNLADNAVLRMNRVIDLLGNYKSDVVFVPTVKHFLAEMAGCNPELAGLFSRLTKDPAQSSLVLDELALKDKALAEEIWPRIRMTITPTMIRGGAKENVIPSECEAVFDCRVLPGQSVADAMDLFKKLLVTVGLDKLSFEVIQAHDGSESTVQTPLYDVAVGVLREFEPSCRVSPTLTTGGTDSRLFRDRGSVCYGFHPMVPDEPNDMLIKRMHGVDERISVRNLVFGVSVLYEVIKRFLS